MMPFNEGRINDELTNAANLGEFAKTLDTARYSFRVLPGFNPCIEQRVEIGYNPFCIDVRFLLRCATAIIYRYEKVVPSDAGDNIKNLRAMLEQYHDYYAKLLSTHSINRKLAFYKAIKESKCSLEPGAIGADLEWDKSFGDDGVEKTINNIQKLKVDYRTISGYDDLPEELRQELDANTLDDIIYYYAV